MKKTISLLSISFLLLGITLPCYASSLPEAEISSKIGLGTGPSVSVDFKVAPRVSLGGSIGSPFYRWQDRGYFTSGLYDVRLLYKFIDQGKLAFSGVLGVTGSPAFYGKFAGSFFGGEAGIALSYQFLPQLTGKLNLVGAFPVWNGAWNWYGLVSPASGIELGYRFNHNLEVSLGGNGQGDFLGINIYF